MGVQSMIWDGLLFGGRSLSGSCSMSFTTIEDPCDDLNVYWWPDSEKNHSKCNDLISSFSDRWLVSSLVDMSGVIYEG